MVSVMAFTSRAPRLQTSADRYYRFFDEGQQIGVDLVVRFENALMQKYDPGKPAIMASNHARQECRYALGMALCRGSACPGRECAARSGGLDAELGPLTAWIYGYDWLRSQFATAPSLSARSESREML
jgi:hypothetical protein